MDVGTDKVKDVAVAAGLRDDDYMADSTVPSYSIGTSSPSAIRMVSSYATFATSGKQREPFSVSEVKHKGEVIYKHETVTKNALESVISDNVTDVLKNVVENGTGTPARIPGRDVGRQDGYHGRQQVGLVRRLHPADLDRRQHVPDGRRRDAEEP